MKRQDVSRIVIEYADQFGPTNRPERKTIEKSLRSVESGELFEGLYALFLLENDEYSYIRQQNAGFILYKLKPKTFINIKERIRLCLSTWDVSVEELPYYLADQVGKTKVLEVLNELRGESLTEREIAALDTFDYWLEKE